jgi:diguanylate cyclase (GGDEF)-like protein
MILAVVSVYLVILLFNSAGKLNTISAETSTAIFDSVIRNELEGMGKLAKDYAYWNDSVERLSLRLDPEFIEDNFLGSYMGDSFDISRVAVANLDKTIIMSIVDGEVEADPNKALAAEPYQYLMQQALQAEMTAPVPVTGFIKMGFELHMVACVPITPHDDQDPRFVFGQAYGLLLMSKKLDAAMINGWAQDFKFNSMMLFSSQQGPADYLAKPVINPLGEHLATIVWRADQPGTIFINNNSPILGGILLILTLITVFFGFNISRYIKMSVAAARELEQSQQELNRLAYYDRITGLPNRSLAIDRLSQSLKSIQRSKLHTAVMFIDLDGFKPVNDKYGHAIGDEILARVGKRVTSCIRKDDTVARVGGDEFLVILTGLASEDDIDEIAKTILQSLGRSFQVGEKAVEITASIGIAVALRDGNDPEELIGRADDAMYCSKHNGKNTYLFFNGLDMVST